MQIMRMCDAFAQNGHQVTLVSGGYGDVRRTERDTYRYYGVPRSFSMFSVSRTPGPGRVYIWAMRAALRARLAGADLVYGRSVLPCYYSARLGLQTVWEVHEPVIDMRPRKLARARRLLADPRLVRLVALSQALGERYRAEFSIAKDRVLVAYNGADDVPDVKPLSLPPGGDSFLVGYAGSLYRGKGVELIVQIAPHCPWATFFVAGGDEAEVNRWRARTIDISNIHFLGHLSQEELAGFRSAVDAVLVPPNRRVIVNRGAEIDQALAPPLKLFEALACGKPVVCSDHLEEVVTDDVNAILCNPEDPQQWEVALQRLAYDAALRQKLASGARKLFENGLSWRARAKLVLSGLDAPAE